MTEYDIIARYYDEWNMDDFSLRMLPFALDLLKKHKVTCKRVVEFACGTGSAAISLSDLGYEVTGIDKSSEMLKIAKEKRSSGRRDVTFIHSDIADFKAEQEFDAAFSFYDSINHISPLPKLKKALKAISGSLRSGGAFVCDINTIYGLRTGWSNASHHRETAKTYSCWVNNYNPKTRIASVGIEVFEKQLRGMYRRTTVNICEKGYAFYELRDILKAAGFENINFYDCFTFQRAHGRTRRAMVFCRKR